MEKISFEEELRRHGSFLFPSAGWSMWPLIRPGRDLVEITKRPPGRLRKYDVVLYKRQGRYILHRILRVREKDYVIAGDNNAHLEYGVTDDMILGVLTAVVRQDGAREELSSLRCRCYTHLWCDAFPVRAALLRGRRLAGRVKHALYRKIRHK